MRDLRALLARPRGRGLTPSTGAHPIRRQSCGSSAGESHPSPGERQAATLGCSLDPFPRGCPRRIPAGRHARPCEGWPWPARQLWRQPPLPEWQPRARRRLRRSDARSLPRHRARHGQRLAFGRWHSGAGYHLELAPRTTTARAVRSPPPTRRRSACRLRPVSAASSPAPILPGTPSRCPAVARSPRPGRGRASMCGRDCPRLAGTQGPDLEAARPALHRQNAAPMRLGGASAFA